MVYKKRVLTQSANMISAPNLNFQGNLKALGDVAVSVTQQNALKADNEAKELAKQQNNALEHYKRSLKTTSMGTIANAYNEFSADPQSFNSALDSARDKVLESIQDEELKQDIALEFETKRLTYGSRVTDNFKKIESTKFKNSFRENANSNLSALKDTASVLVSSNPDNNAYIDYRMQLQDLVNTKDNTDENGNYLLPERTRNEIADFNDNVGYHSTLQWVNENYADDTASVIKLRDTARNNKTEFAEKYNMPKERVNEFIDGLDEVIEQSRTTEELLMAEQARQELDFTYNGFKIKNGKIRNFKANNVMTMLDYNSNLQEEYENGNLNFKYYSKKKAETDTLLKTMLKDKNARVTGNSYINKALSEATPKLDEMKTFVGWSDDSDKFNNMRLSFYENYLDNLDVVLSERNIASDEIGVLKKKERNVLFNDAYNATIIDIANQAGINTENKNIESIETEYKYSLHNQIRQQSFEKATKTVSQAKSNTKIMRDANNNMALVEIDEQGNPIKVIKEL
jgi:hypothetical protein